MKEGLWAFEARREERMLTVPENNQKRLLSPLNMIEAASLHSSPPIQIPK